MKTRRVLLAAILFGILGGAIALLATNSPLVDTAKTATAQLQPDSRLPSFQGATGWLNTQPLSAADLRGKVVLVNFWTFTCINWLRQLPYVRAWAEKYKEQGLVVIGVHTPEFVFEQESDNVRRAAKDMDIGYAIAIDSRYAVWRAFNNQYWPALYFVDAQGRIRHHQFGEGGYEQSERVIQQLLTEAGAGRGDQGQVALNARGSEAPADWPNLKSPENYLGYARTENFVPVGGIQEDIPNRYPGFASLPLNWWSLTGVWTVGGEFASLMEASGRITYRFHARDLHLVMAPSMPGQPVRFRVRLDGAPPGDSHGVDLDAEGWGTLQEGRLYQLIRQSGPIADRTFEIEFTEPGVRAYALTFG